MPWMLVPLLLVPWAVRLAFASARGGDPQGRAPVLPDSPPPISGFGASGGDSRAPTAATRRLRADRWPACALGHGERTLRLPVGGLRRGK